MKQEQEKINLSESQTKRFEKMLEEDPNNINTKAFLRRERQLDGFVQRLKEKEEVKTEVK